MKIKRFDSARLDTRDIALKLKEILDLCYGESPWSEVYLLSNLKRDVYFLAEVDDEIVGFLAVQVVMEEMEITNLAVKPEFQSKKIASSLMDQINNFSGTLF